MLVDDLNRVNHRDDLGMIIVFNHILRRIDNRLSRGTAISSLMMVWIQSHNAFFFHIISTSIICGDIYHDWTAASGSSPAMLILSNGLL